MRILVDVGHPAQVHFFKNLIDLAGRRGQEVLVTARAKDVTTQLLKTLGIPFVELGARRRGVRGLAREYVERIVRMQKLAREFRPDVMLALTGVTIGPVGALLGIPRIVLEEAEHARAQRALGLPFATRILTGSGYRGGDHGDRQVRFKGFWVEAYLDGRYFRSDPQALRRAGVNPDEPIIVLRTVSWSALHDLSGRPAGMDELKDSAENLSRFGRVLVSSEEPLPEEFKQYANPVPIEHMHDLLAHATLLVGDGGTMAAEAALLGRPAVYCSRLRCGYLMELADRYGLIRMADSFAEGVEIAEELLAGGDLGEKWRRRRAEVPPCEDISEHIYQVIEETVSQNRPERRHGIEGRSGPPISVTTPIVRTEARDQAGTGDYAWSSITMGTINVGNHLIEWSLKRALKLGEPLLTFDSFKRLDATLAERINRECRFVLSPGSTVLEPGQNEAYGSFGVFRVPTPCFGGCLWGARRGRAEAVLAMVAPRWTGRLRGAREERIDEEKLAVARELSQPVGARDPYTFEVLRGAGIETRLVGCPTLMTERAMTSWRRTEGRHAVVSMSRDGLATQCRLIRGLRRRWKVTVLVHEGYERRVLRLIRGIEVVEFESCEQFAELYAQADLVVTGRLHGVLPAMAHGTPVLFYGDRNDTRFTLLEHLGVHVHELSSGLVEAAGRREATAPEGTTFEKVSELRRAFADYARGYGIDVRFEP